ncbi:MAG: putative Ig domain-containing protein, partial [Magnetococcus sp. WYHC-3]
MSLSRTTPDTLAAATTPPFIPPSGDAVVASPPQRLQIPDGAFLTQGDLAREGNNLVLSDASGNRLIISDWFALPQPPTLEAPNGARLTPDMVTALLDQESHPGPLLAGPPPAPGQAPAVGRVEEMTGRVIAKAPDGPPRLLEVGAEIHQGEQIRTEKGALVRLRFRDDTLFQLGENARMVVDKYVFNPEEAEGEFAATVLRGVFRYESGRLAGFHPQDEHSLIRTPAARIGIRGSALQGEVGEQGETTVVHDAGHLTISDMDGLGIVSLVESGTATSVAHGDAPTQVFQAPPELLQRWNTQVSDMAIAQRIEATMEAPAPVQPAPEAPHAPQATSQTPTPQTTQVPTAPGMEPGADLPAAMESPADEIESFAQRVLDAASLLDENALDEVTGDSFAREEDAHATGQDVDIAPVGELVERLQITPPEPEPVEELPAVEPEAPLPPPISLNTAPQVTGSVGTLQATEDALFRQTLGTGLFHDQHSDDSDLTLSVTRADGSALPAWLSFDAATRTLEGTPENADVGSLELRLSASDGALSASSGFRIDVANTNDTPFLVNPASDARVDVGTALALTLPASLFSDPDVGDSLTWSLTRADGSALPAWLGFDPA